MLKAESRCRTFYAGKVPFSDVVNQAGAAVAFLKVATKYRQGGKVSKIRIRWTQIKAKMQSCKWKDLAIKKLKKS